ncbi:MAG: hypothetical protein KC448_00395 [Yoonia sp.]|nr:hypothetical protein [Yoonia sp.]
MSDETNLDELVKSLCAILVEDLNVFVTSHPDLRPANLNPRMIFEDPEGTTLSC